MVPLHTLQDKAHHRRASAALTSQHHSHGAVLRSSQPTATILYAHRKQPSNGSDASSALASSAQSILHSSSSFDDRLSSSLCTFPSKQPRLTDCDLLFSVLECYMTLQIERNERLQACESPSPTATQRASQREKACQQPKQEPSVFHALQPPSITPVEYLRRLARYAFCSRSAFILAFYYLQTIANTPHAYLTLNSLSIHRLLLTATLLATKMVDDILYDNAHFAKVGGLDVKELNVLELDMLSVLRFELCVSAEQFEAFERSVLSDVVRCDHSQFMMLRERLRNMGYALDEQLPPSSPVSSLDDFSGSDV